MRIAITHVEADAAARWRDALAQRLPDAIVGDDATTPDADYAVAWRPPAGFFARQRRLRAVFAAGAGVDALVAHPQLPGALPVIRLEDAGMGRQMAEYCCHEVFRRYRGFDRYEAQQPRGEWREIEPPPPAQFTVGVFGMGTLGRVVARALSAFGYRVLGFTRTAQRAPGPGTAALPWPAGPLEHLHGADGLARLLAESQVLVLIAPLTAATAGIVDRDWLARMRSDAWLVNVARGGLVVEPDLLKAIDAGRIAGATLDVFREEPLPAAHPFRTHPRIRVTPHVAAITLVDEGATQVADKIGRLSAGLPVGGVVDRERGY